MRRNKVGPGWTLAMYSATQAGYGVKFKAGPSTLFLVNPQGGRYRLVTWSARSPRAHWFLLDWSGDVSRALFATSPAGAAGTGREHVYQLQLRTGRVSALTLPAHVAAVGYTRPDGLNILAMKPTSPNTGSNNSTLQRYSLTGKLQKNLASVTGLAAFGASSGVAYSSDGTELAAGTVNGLELIRTRMWLVPASGARPTALTPVRAGGFDLGDFNAWQLSSGLYVDGFGACGTLVIGRQPAHGKEQQVNVPGADSTLVVNATRSKLMVERINACSPGVSLVWFTPATRIMRVAIGAGKHQVGVQRVVPYFITGMF